MIGWKDVKGVFQAAMAPVARFFARQAGLGVVRLGARPAKPAQAEPADLQTAPYTNDSDDARAKFDRWKDADPFPKIAPALLNSADIDDYMRATSMVFPYYPDNRKKRKTASYALSVGNEIAYWNPERPSDPPIQHLERGDPVVIPPNSLVYVRTGELFQLPNYMAVRFNLHIDLVHKGLLLGTGPLVDPGFWGHLMVPLHNLTNNTYMLGVGDDFIWAEFTKTSSIPKWEATAPDAPARVGSLMPFPNRKVDRSLFEYIESALRGHKALQPGYIHKTLQNAIPDAISGARKTALKASRKAKRTQQFVVGIGGIALLSIGYALVNEIEVNRTSLQATVTILRDTNETVERQEERIKSLEQELADKKGDPRHNGNKSEAK